MVKEGLLYTKEHEWAKIEGNVATVGIADHAQELLGELTYVELPDIGREVKQHDEIGVVESSKSASDVYAPVTGKVTEVNDALQSNPETINDDCYDKGWICKLDITDKDSAKKLMDAVEYEKYLEGLE